MYHRTLHESESRFVFVCLFTLIVPSFCSMQATDGDAGTFGIVRYYFSDEPDQ